MIRTLIVAIVICLFAVPAQAGSIAKAILPGSVEVGARATTYEGGVAQGLSLNGIYDINTTWKALPQYLGIAFEQLSDAGAPLSNIARAELLWEPVSREGFGVVFGGGASAEGFGVADTHWGWHYGAGFTVDFGETGKFIVTARDNDLNVADATIGAGFIAELPF